MNTRTLTKRPTVQLPTLPRLLLLALFFLAGVLLGQVLSGRVPDTTGDELRRYLEDYVRLGGEGAPTVQTALSALVIYFRYPLFAFLLGFASIGVVLLPCVTAAYGFFLSFSVCCFTAAFGVDGVLLALAVFGLRCLVTLPCYFLLAAAAGVCHTYLEISAGLNADAGLLNWVYLIYMDLLYCYLAAALHGWKRWVLLSGALLHILLSALWSFAALPLLASAAGDWLGTTLFLLAAALLLFSHEQPLRRTSLFLCAVAGGLFAFWGVTRFSGSGIFYPLTNPVTTLLAGYPHAFYAILCGFAGALCAVQVVTNFVRETLLRQRRMQGIIHIIDAAELKSLLFIHLIFSNRTNIRNYTGN